MPVNPQVLVKYPAIVKIFRLIEALKCLPLNRWAKLVEMPPQIMGEIMNWYKANIDPEFDLGLGDVNYEFSRDFCAPVLCLIMIHKCVGQ